MANIKSANLKLWVYSGVFGQKAVLTPNYTIYKEKLPTDDIVVFEVAELIRDFIDIEFDGDYDNIKQNVWVEWEMTRVFDDDTSDLVEGSGIAFDGYGYFEEGINPELSYGLLQSNTIMYVKEGDLARIPVYTGSDGTFKVDYYKAGTLLVSNTYGTDITPITIDSEAYNVDNDAGIITTDLTHLKSQSSNPTSSSVAYGDPDTAVIVDVYGNQTVVYINYLTECKYEPNKVSFTNKFGVIQDLYFFKRRDDSVNVSKDSFKANTLNFGTSALSYSTSVPQNKDFNVNGTKSLKLNTGFVDEQFNEVIKQLIMSENVWIHEDGEVYPIRPKTDSLEMKKSINSKLIDYAIDFDYSFDTINSIR